VVRTRADEDSVAVDGRSSQRLMVKGHGRTENGGCLFFPLRSFTLINNSSFLLEAVFDADSITLL
jgi:hypothetical protein